jgi:translation initiation factor IF-3
LSKKTEKEGVLLNENIDAPMVRCIGEDGKQYGIISTQEALEKAEEKGLDLVLVAPNANPPVCKIMDFGKFKYQQEKKKKEAKKKQAKIEIKEIKLSVKIAKNDIDYKIKHAREFLEKGKHVRFRVFLKGREMSHPESGVEVLQRVAPLILDIASIEKEPHVEGRYVNMMAVPKKEEKKKMS